jgi:hypothetical protein
MRDASKLAHSSPFALGWTEDQKSATNHVSRPVIPKVRSIAGRTKTKSENYIRRRNNTLFSGG